MDKRLINAKKRIIREKVFDRLNMQKEVERLKKSRVIQRKLFALQEFKKAKNIMFFASFDKEVETFRMMRQAMKLDKQVVLPLVLKNKKQIVPSKIRNLEKELDIGPYGIKQPKLKKSRVVSLDKIDLVTVPGVAFDRKGNRLGRGAGYYDRFLKKIPKDTPTIGLAFRFQILKTLPYIKDKDIPVDKVIFA
jgi:5-formyltetrahydrofolate cyclo-ligase